MPKCKFCKEVFERTKPLQVVCYKYDCMIGHAKLKAENKSREIKKAVRRKDKVKKESLKSKDDLIKDAQPYFNKFIRLRDYDSPCISCGKYAHELKINHIITLVCGHYLSVGANTELRFTEDNAHLQCTRCNGGAGKYGNFNNKAITVTQNYRINLIEKIGLERVEFLEGPHPMPNWSKDDIREIKKTYMAKCRVLK